MAAFVACAESSYHLIDCVSQVRTMVIPDIWIEAGSQKEQYDIAELNPPHIQAKVEGILQKIRESR